MSYQRNVANQELGFALINASSGAPLLGATVNAYRSVGGAAQVAVAGTVSEKGNGQYVLTMAASDLPAATTSFFFTATSAIPVEKTVVTGLGLYARNTAGQHLGFGLVSATTGLGVTGATVTVYRSVDGATQATATGTVTELGLGHYDFAPSAADLDGEEVTFLFRAAGAVPLEKTVLTQDAPADASLETPSPRVDIQGALVAYLQSQGLVVALLGAPPMTRLYPEFAPPDATGLWCCYTVTQDDRPTTLNSRAGYGTARIRLDCWADGASQGHLRANELYLSLWGVLNGYRGNMGEVFVQRASCENGSKNSPPAPIAGQTKPEANASLDVVLWFNDL